MFVIIIRVTFNEGQGQQFARDAFSCLRQSPYHVLMMMALTFSDESLARDIHTDTQRLGVVYFNIFEVALNNNKKRKVQKGSAVQVRQITVFLHELQDMLGLWRASGCSLNYFTYLEYAKRRLTTTIARHSYHLHNYVSENKKELKLI